MFNGSFHSGGICGNGGTVRTSLTSASRLSVPISGPEDAAVDAARNVYVADTNDNAVRKIWLSGGLSPSG